MRLYRALLALYPSSFRRQYGAEMVGIFARRRREAAGSPAVAALWAETVADVLVSAAAAHWDVLMQDLRYAARSLGRAPVFAGTALVVVALGVGANTAVFSVTDYVLIRPLPFAAPDRLVKLWERLPGYEQMEPSPANYRDWKRMSTSFASMGAFSTQSYNLSGQGEPVRLEGAMVTSEVLPLLGVRPTLGRLFAAAEDRPGAAARSSSAIGCGRSSSAATATCSAGGSPWTASRSWSSASCRASSSSPTARCSSGCRRSCRRRPSTTATTTGSRWWRGSGLGCRSARRAPR